MNKNVYNVIIIKCMHSATHNFIACSTISIKVLATILYNIPTVLAISLLLVTLFTVFVTLNYSCAVMSAVPVNNLLATKFSKLSKAYCIVVFINCEMW